MMILLKSLIKRRSRRKSPSSPESGKEIDDIPWKHATFDNRASSVGDRSSLDDHPPCSSSGDPSHLGQKRSSLRDRKGLNLNPSLLHYIRRGCAWKALVGQIRRLHMGSFKLQGPINNRKAPTFFGPGLLTKGLDHFSIRFQSPRRVKIYSRRPL